MEIIELIGYFVGAITLGFILFKNKLANENWYLNLNAYAFYIGLPAIIIQSLNAKQINWQVSHELIYTNLILIICWISLVFIVLRFIQQVPHRATYLFTLSYGNISFIGIPLIGTLTHQTQTTSIVAALHLIGVMTLGLWLSVRLHKKENGNLAQFSPKILIKNPIILAVILGLTLNLLKATPQNFILKMSAFFAPSATPVILISLGVFIGVHLKVVKHYWKAALKYTLIKIIVLPLLVLLVLRNFNLDTTALTISTLQFAMPCAIAPFVMAKQFKFNQNLIAAFIILSTLCLPFSFIFLAYLLGGG